MIFEGAESEFSYRTDIFAFPFFPSFVVTNTTPLAPFAPYKEVAVASFIMEKVAILSGSIRAKSEADTCKPSSKIKGPLLNPKVVTPLIKKAALSCPGSPDLW